MQLSGRIYSVEKKEDGGDVFYGFLEAKGGVFNNWN
jgi:hypothetical protein